jgi:hypothetical protein
MVLSLAPTWYGMVFAMGRRAAPATDRVMMIPGPQGSLETSNLFRNEERDAKNSFKKV